jgi:xanthine dehydrogenase molybdopterin-binding subunit B
MFHDHVERGNVEEAFKQADTVVEGEFNLGGALHWYARPHSNAAHSGPRLPSSLTQHTPPHTHTRRYMEPHSCLVEPKDDGGLLIHCTAQSVALVQEEVRVSLSLSLSLFRPCSCVSGR